MPALDRAGQVDAARKLLNAWKPQEVSASMQETSAATEQIAAGAAELARTAARLEELVQTFRIKG